MSYGRRSRVGTSVSGWSKRPTAGVGYGTATGGSSSPITVDSQAYTLLTFTSSSTLTVTKAGLFDVLIIGGGSSALSGWNGNGRPGSPGGGAGGALNGQVYLSTNATVTIGAGGADPTGPLEYYLGSDSLVGAFLGSGSASGRGQAPSWSAGAQPANVEAQFGTAGGSVGGSDGGGGGGQGAAGSGRNGGDGKDWSSFRGETAGTTYYGGGGAGISSGGSTGTGGVGGGANSQGNGLVNTGGGGGGGDQGNAGAGGSGIVLVRFKV